MNAIELDVAGCRFRLTPADALSVTERDVARQFPRPANDSSEPPFTIRVVSSPPWTPDDDPGDGVPALITTAGPLVRVSHARFLGEIDPLAGEAVLFRRDASDAAALEIFLRVALGCRLPSHASVLLHSAAVVIDEQAVIFFGPSGAGKSTLAGVLDVPVLSDELVAVSRNGGRWTASGSGFWGTQEEVAPDPGKYPIRALVELRRGTGLAIEALPKPDALRRLLLVMVAPPVPVVWRDVLRLAVQMTEEVPLLTMAWTPGPDTADQLRKYFAR